MKSLKRLGIDPLAVYGTLCVKCPVGDPSLADPACIARVLEELAIVAPKIVVVMGEDALAALNDLDVPLARPLDPRAGRRPAVHAGVRRARRAEHRRGPRRGGGQARVLVGLQGAGRVVRGPAALLAVVGAALAYFLVAPELPQLHPPELSALVACAVGLTFVVAIVAGLAAVADSPLALVPARRSAPALLVAALDANDVGGGGDAVRGRPAAAAWGSPSPSSSTRRRSAVALPLFLAAIDIAQAHGGGSAGLFTLSTSKPGDALTLELPDWGTGLAAARLSATDVVFLGAFAAYARRLGLRERAAELGMLVGLLVAVASEVLLDSELPTIALMAVGLPGAQRRPPRRPCSRVPQASNVGRMDLEEKTLEQVGDRCEECGAKLTERELEQVLESGGPALCTVHAQEEVAVSDEDALDGADAV